jgi:DNA-binding MarR family transcriptional regulator
VTEILSTEIPASEREFVRRIGLYYEKDGMAADRGEVIGWLVISDPPRQSASEIIRKLQVSRETVDRVADQLVPAGFLSREDIPGGDDYYLTLQDSAWPAVVQHTFASFPRFHKVMEDGLAALSGEDSRRTARLSNMERLFAYLAKELPVTWQRYEKMAG